MNRIPTALRALALVPALALLGGCIFSIDTRGADWASHGDHDRSYHSSSGPTIVGTGIEREEERTVPAFRGIEASGDVRVTVTIAPERGPVVVRGDDNLIGHLRTSVERDVLRIGFEEGNFQPRRRMEVSVTCPSIETLSLLGSGDVEVSEVAAQSLAVTLSGNGEVRVSGAADWLDVLLNGSGDARLADLKARKARVILNGSGDVDLRATEELEAKVTGSGDVRYRGNPQVNFSVHGSGSIRAR